MRSYRQKNLEVFSRLGVCKKFPSKTILEASGKPKAYVYLLLHGTVRQYFIAPEGTEKTLLLLSRGDLFGEITGLQQDCDQVFTQSLSPVSVCQIPIKDFITLLQKDSSVSYAINQMLSYKFRILMAQLQDSSFCDAGERLKNLLLRLSAQQGIPTKYGIQIPCRYTHEELAGMISSTRSTVSRKMKLLQEEGFLTVRNRCLYIHPPAKIE